MSGDLQGEFFWNVSCTTEAPGGKKSKERAPCAGGAFGFGWGRGELLFVVLLLFYQGSPNRPKSALLLRTTFVAMHFAFSVVTIFPSIFSLVFLVSFRLWKSECFDRPVEVIFCESPEEITRRTDEEVPHYLPVAVSARHTGRLRWASSNWSAAACTAVFRGLPGFRSVNLWCMRTLISLTMGRRFARLPWSLWAPGRGRC